MWFIILLALAISQTAAVDLPENGAVFADFTCASISSIVYVHDFTSYTYPSFAVVRAAFIGCASRRTIIVGTSAFTTSVVWTELPNECVSPTFDYQAFGTPQQQYSEIGLYVMCIEQTGVSILRIRVDTNAGLVFAENVPYSTTATTHMLDQLLLVGFGTFMLRSTSTSTPWSTYSIFTNDAENRPGVLANSGYQAHIQHVTNAPKWVCPNFNSGNPRDLYFYYYSDDANGVASALIIAQGQTMSPNSPELRPFSGLTCGRIYATKFSQPTSVQQDASSCATNIYLTCGPFLGVLRYTAQTDSFTTSSVPLSSCSSPREAMSYDNINDVMYIECASPSAILKITHASSIPAEQSVEVVVEAAAVCPGGTFTHFSVSVDRLTIVCSFPQASDEVVLLWSTAPLTVAPTTPAPTTPAPTAIPPGVWLQQTVPGCSTYTSVVMLSRYLEGSRRNTGIESASIDAVFVGCNAGIFAITHPFLATMTKSTTLTSQSNCNALFTDASIGRIETSHVIVSSEMWFDPAVFYTCEGVSSNQLRMITISSTNVYADQVVADLGPSYTCDMHVPMDQHSIMRCRETETRGGMWEWFHFNFNKQPPVQPSELMLGYTVLPFPRSTCYFEDYTFFYNEDYRFLRLFRYDGSIDTGGYWYMMEQYGMIPITTDANSNCIFYFLSIGASKALLMQTAITATTGAIRTSVGIPEVDCAEITSLAYDSTVDKAFVVCYRPVAIYVITDASVLISMGTWTGSVYPVASSHVCPTGFYSVSANNNKLAVICHARNEIHYIDGPVQVVIPSTVAPTLPAHFVVCGQPLCSGHGQCQSTSSGTSCLCDAPWVTSPGSHPPCDYSGESCRRDSGSLMCSGRGTCAFDTVAQEAVCTCDSGYIGKYCEVQKLGSCCDATDNTCSMNPSFGYCVAYNPDGSARSVAQPRCYPAYYTYTSSPRCSSTLCKLNTADSTGDYCACQRKDKSTFNSTMQVKTSETTTDTLTVCFKSCPFITHNGAAYTCGRQDALLPVSGGVATSKNECKVNFSTQKASCVCGSGYIRSYNTTQADFVCVPRCAYGFTTGTTTATWDTYVKCDTSGNCVESWPFGVPPCLSAPTTAAPVFSPQPTQNTTTTSTAIPTTGQDATTTASPTTEAATTSPAPSTTSIATTAAATVNPSTSIPTSSQNSTNADALVETTPFVETASGKFVIAAIAVVALGTLATAVACIVNVRKHTQTVHAVDIEHT